MICEQASDAYRANANPNTPTPTPSNTKIKSANQNSIGLMKSRHTRERSTVSVLTRLPISLSQSLLARLSSAHVNGQMQAGNINTLRVPKPGDFGQLRRKCVPELWRARARRGEAGMSDRSRSTGGARAGLRWCARTPTRRSNCGVDDSAGPRASSSVAL